MCMMVKVTRKVVKKKKKDKLPWNLLSNEGPEPCTTKQIHE